MTSEAQVAIRADDVVSIGRPQLAMIARAARLFAAVFEGEVDPDDIVDQACEAGLTIDVDDEGAEDGIDTYVMLSPDFESALNEAGELANILPGEAA